MSDLVQLMEPNGGLVRPMGMDPDIYQRALDRLLEVEADRAGPGVEPSAELDARIYAALRNADE